jgi:tetratricopeptide (TPR) repeat protein
MNSSYDITKRERLLDIISRNAEDSRSSLMARNELARLCSEEGFLDEAITMQQETLELQRGRGEADLKLATLSILPFLHEARNQFIQVEETLKQELDLRREKSGAGDRDTLVAMWHLAKVYKRLGKFQDAATLLKSVISVQKTVCGDDHFDTRKKNIKALANYLSYTSYRVLCRQFNCITCNYLDVPQRWR